MPERYKRYSIREKEAKIILDKASEKLKLDLGLIFKGKFNFEILEVEPKIFLVNGKPVLFETDNKVYPTLVFNEFISSAPEIVVDMGAVPHICKGANIMAPGVVQYKRSFEKGDIVSVIDEKHGKALAVGKALHDSEEAKNVKQGVVVKNLHFVSDRVWQLLKNLTKD